MKLLTLDLAKQTGWAAVSDTGKIFSGHVKFEEVEFDDLAFAFSTWLEQQLDTFEPDLVAYEAPVVKHPHATKILVGISWLTILACKKRGIKCVPVTNTQAKKHWVGRSYGKDEKPYPGIEEARRRGFSPRSTDEADALAILSYATENFDQLNKPRIHGDGSPPSRRAPSSRRGGKRGRRSAKR